MAELQHIPLVSEEQHQRQLRRSGSPDGDLWDLLDAVVDPEIPVLSLWDLGVLQNVRRDGQQVVVEITPTYSGCPAMVEMSQMVEACLRDAGCAEVQVKTLLAPAWSTDFMTDQGRQKLREYGIAPPLGRAANEKICCPQCGSANSQRISEFGSTACKALYRCGDCLEPFDYFKCI